MKPIILIALALVACTPTKFVGPNGREAYSLDCNTMGLRLPACMKKASELCPNGYTLVDTSGGTVIGGTGGTIVGGPVNYVTVECK